MQWQKETKYDKLYAFLLPPVYFLLHAFFVAKVVFGKLHIKDIALLSKQMIMFGALEVRYHHSCNFYTFFNNTTIKNETCNALVNHVQVHVIKADQTELTSSTKICFRYFRKAKTSETIRECKSYA